MSDIGADFITVARLDEIAVGGCKVVSLSTGAAGPSRFVALFNLAGTIHAIDHECPHEGGPLGAGEVDGRIVICPWHGWAFAVVTGRGPTSPGVQVETIAVRLVDDEVQIQIDLSAAKSLWDW